MKKIILASTSPRRKALLEQAGITFDILATDCDEHCSLTEPADYVEELAMRKCTSGADKAMKSGAADALIIGSDTVVAYNGNILGKPKDKEDAFRMLKMLSGNTHHVYTGIALKDLSTAHLSVFHEETAVKFYDVSDEEIRAYIDDGEPMDKAGAYGIQGKGVFLVERIEGDYNNVVGLPVARLMRIMKKQGFIR